MDEVAILKETRELFAATHWTQGDFYTREDGKAYFCAVGGIRRVWLGEENAILIEELDPYEGGREYQNAIRRLAAAIGVGLFYSDYDDDEPRPIGEIESDIVKWNDADDRGLPEVLIAFDRAIATPPSGG